MLKEKMKQQQSTVSPRPKILLNCVMNYSIEIQKHIKQLKGQSKRGQRKQLLDDAERISSLIYDLTKKNEMLSAEEAMDRLEFVEQLFDTLSSMIDSFFADNIHGEK